MTLLNFILRSKPQNGLAILIPCVLCWLFAYIGIFIYRDYSWGLFIGLPFFLGAASTFIYTWKRSVARVSARNHAFKALLIFCIGLLLFAWEGVICLIMVSPLGLLFTYIGYLLTYELQKAVSRKTSNATLIILLVSVPGLMAFDHSRIGADELRSVQTTIDINASPEQVWRQVVSFPELNDPTEFLFKAGIAFPINATINGSGVGAVRHCNFSTGAFVEPITTWDQPRLLAFSVEQQPEPMKEISPYKISPNHLHGYWVSKKGQFRLIRLPNGNTRLEGTTWYVNRIKPDFYWTLWSDYIVHTIHQRVLSHIKEQTELLANHQQP